MSYCRFTSAAMVEQFKDDPDIGPLDLSDVYVYADIGGYLCCCACSLSDEWKHHSTDAMVAHLREHIAAGHAVPDDVIPALLAERAENDAWMAEAKS